MLEVCGRNTSPFHRPFSSSLYIFLHMFCFLIFDIFRRSEEVNKLLFLYTGQIMPNNSPRMMGNNKFAELAYASFLTNCHEHLTLKIVIKKKQPYREANLKPLIPKADTLPLRYTTS